MRGHPRRASLESRVREERALTGKCGGKVAIVLDLDAATATSFFGGGRAVAKYCDKHLHIELSKKEGFHNNLPIAVEETFLRMDEILRDREAGKELSKCQFNYLFLEKKPFFEGAIGDGCTACVALVTRDRIIVGNAGDSRCVLSRNVQAIPLSIDHKPILPAETQRIVVAVHEIIVNPGRGSIPHVDDGIAISRAIGDLRYKGKPRLGPQHQVVTASPEAHSEQMTHNDEFLVIACDEIWDCMTNQEWVDYVRLHLKNDLELWRIRESLLSHCLAQLKGRTYLSYRLGSRNPRKRPTTWRRPPWGLVLQRATAPRSAPGPPTCCRPRWDLVHQHPARTVRSGPLTADLGAADAGRVDVPKLQRSSSSGP